MLVASERLALTVKEIQAIAGSNPQRTGPRLIDGRYGIARHGVWVQRIILVTNEGFTLTVKEIEAVVRSNPQRTRAVFKDGGNEVIRKGVWILGVLAEDSKGIAIKPVEAIPRAKPHEAVFVLPDTPDA